VPVVLFHAGFSGFSGGYVGVDVFFVISGFLITGIIAREIESHSFSILEFYRRRALRIFPALTLVTFATLAAGLLFLSPRELTGVAESSAYMSVFGSNFYFWRSVSYFQTTAEIRPLLHTWSLAVEEQYYVLFPPLLWLLHRWRRRFSPALWTIAALSLVASVLLVSWKPNAAFYLLPSRAWELMIGGLLAVGVLPEPRRLATPLSIVGLALIALPMATYNEATPFPGLAAVPPVLGTALVIWAGREALAGRWLSYAPLVAVGKASYSIYLWHLPLLAYATYLVADTLSTPAALFLCAVSIALGFASLQWVERPFRAKGPHRNRKAFIAALGMVAIAAVSLSILAFQGIPARLSPEAARIAFVADDENRHHSDCMTLGEHIVPPAHACRLGADSQPSALLWGDSHAMVTATAMELTAREKGRSFLFAADADCPIGLGLAISAQDYGYCVQYNREMLQLALSSPNIRTIALSSRWTKWNMGEPANPADFPSKPPLLRYRMKEARTLSDNKALWEESFTALVDRLTAAGKRVVIVGPLPEPSFNVPHRLFVQRFGFAKPVTALSRDDNYALRHRAILDFFGRLRGRKGLSFVWPAEVLCQADKCPIVDQDGPLFFDHNHLSIHGARKISPLFASVFDN
jgi:peptidoglycan/LPS O-acetylase OafA/YrhL